MNPEEIRANFSDFGRILQYMLVGSLGFVVDNGALYFLVESASVNVTVSKIISAELAIAANFMINDFWTFGEHNSGSLIARFLKSNAIRVLGVLIALTVLKILYEGFGVHLIIANSLGILIGFTSNYVLESIFTWKIHKEVK